MAVFQDVLINFLQVKQGYSCHYNYYEKDQTPLDRMLYSSAEIEAREKFRGLWSTPANAHNIAPSHWVIQSKSATRQVNSFPALMSVVCRKQKLIREF
jgi:endonuclease YncB( thermonuclease family)